MGRSLIVGDVHGCRAELEQLLAELRFAPPDRLFFVGDLLARGPDSEGVLALCRQLGARSVCGNHEGRLLDALRARRGEAKRPRLSPEHYKLLQRLGAEDWAYIEALPLFLELPEHGLCIVHAGLVPGVPIEAQDAWTLTHVRSLDAAGRASDRAEFEPWAASYRGPPHVVFGHNSRLGLQLHPDATGIDTACVYGGRLSALVLQAGEPVPADVAARREHLHSVPARAAYYTGRG